MVAVFFTYGPHVSCRLFQLLPVACANVANVIINYLVILLVMSVITTIGYSLLHYYFMHLEILFGMLFTSLVLSKCQLDLPLALRCFSLFYERYTDSDVISIK